MLDEDKSCRDIVVQLSAIRSSIDRAIGVVVAENLIDCIEEESITQEDRDEKIKEAIDLVIKKEKFEPAICLDG